MKNEALQALSREQLEQLIQLYCKNWLAMDVIADKFFGKDDHSRSMEIMTACGDHENGYLLLLHH